MLIRSRFKEVGIYLLGILQLLSICETSKDPDCYYQSNVKWILSKEGKELRDYNSKPCDISESTQTDYMMCDNITSFRLKSCRCIMKQKKPCRFKSNVSCSDVCNASKVCANGGTPEQQICDKNTVVYKGNVTCKCRSGGDSRGEDCGEVKETRLCSVAVKDNRRIYEFPGITYYCSDPFKDIDDIENIKKKYKPCSTISREPNLSSDKLTGNNNTSKSHQDISPCPSNSKKMEHWLIGVIVVSAVIIVVLIIYIIYLRRKLRAVNAGIRNRETGCLSNGHSSPQAEGLLSDGTQNIIPL